MPDPNSTDAIGANDEISDRDRLAPYLLTDAEVSLGADGILECAIVDKSLGIHSNSTFFGHPVWGRKYLDACHRDDAFKERWLAALGSWDAKIVVDVGCGPGNLRATLGGTPKLLIGVDVSRGALKMARELGYTPLLADAHRMPFVNGFADIVTANATLHHCDRMPVALAESARLVRPGGLLIADHDPQLTAWNFRGLALALYKVRLPIYRWFLRSLHVPREERLSALATEVHHRPGHGVTAELFMDTLTPLGFDVALYPHNNAIGAEALEGNPGGPPPWRYRLGQRLSGIDPKSREAALSLMCIARRRRVN